MSPQPRARTEEVLRYLQTSSPPRYLQRIAGGHHWQMRKYWTGGTVDDACIFNSVTWLEWQTTNHDGRCNHRDKPEARGGGECAASGTLVLSLPRPYQARCQDLHAKGAKNTTLAHIRHPDSRSSSSTILTVSSVSINDWSLGHQPCVDLLPL
jgi:hypothetical protein